MAKSAKEYIDLLISRGMSQAEIAHEMQRDSSLISQIRRGKKPGSNMVGSLKELADTGSVMNRPPRRKTSKGSYSHVRGSKGQGNVLPKGVDEEERMRKTKGRRVRNHVDVPARGKYVKHPTEYGANMRRYKVDFPKTKDAKGRVAAWEALRKDAESLNRKTWGDKELPERRAYFKVTYADGSTAEVGSKGGYCTETVLAGIEEHKGDFESWLKTQGLGERYLDLNPDTPFVSIEMVGVKK